MSHPDLSWWDEAACAGLAGEEGSYRTFFPGRGDVEAAQARARSICRTCPVRAQCLDYALANHVRGGIWAGLDENERAAERNARRRRAS